MSINESSDQYQDIDEAEEEALLKSDDESNGASSKFKKTEEATSTLLDEDSLMIEAAQLSSNEPEITVEDISDEDDAYVPSQVDVEDDDDGESDDDDIEEDDVDEYNKVLLDYKNTLNNLEKNPYHYDGYVRLCDLSHGTGDLDYIRKAYKKFSSAYPLTPDLWLKYIDVEISVAQSPQEIANVNELFKTAFKDYYSTKLAFRYCDFAAKCEKEQNIWNFILTTFGITCMKGREFFKLYREFLTKVEKLSDEEKQDLFIKSYVLELKYPLYNMEESYIEFKVFFEKNKDNLAEKLNWKTVDKQYFRAKEHLTKILPYEQIIEAADAGPDNCVQRSMLYLDYVKAAEEILDEDVLASVYERMVADCCLLPNCWLAYADYLDQVCDKEYKENITDLPLLQQHGITVMKRALRNCPWAVELYTKLMNLLEKEARPRAEVQAVLESSTSAGFQTPEPAVTIWMEYLTYLRRQTDWQNEEDCDILRKNFKMAWSILGQQWGVLADCNCEILQFWGRLEYGPLQDAKLGKELWTTVMESADNSTKSALWIEFAQLELRRDLESTKKLYQKALHSPGLDNAPAIVSAWERFERCNGTRKSLVTCLKECKTFLLSYCDLKADAGKGTAATEVKTKTAKRKSTTKPNATDVSSEKKAKTSDKQVQKKSTPDKHDSSKTFKEHENQEIDLAKDHLRIFLSNLDYNVNEDDIRTGLPELQISNVNLIRSGNGRSRGFGYLELENEAAVEKALSMDGRHFQGRPLYVSSVLRDKEKRQKFKYAATLEPKKLFVKGLPLDIKKEELEELFAVHGKLKDVRLCYHKSGKFKNIAYVDYEDESAASKAVLTMDQKEIRGHIMSVAISAPPPRTNAATAVNTTKLLKIAKKQNKMFEQKPRMSLIPNAVRKNFNNASTSAAALATNGSDGTKEIPVAKTNDDFRKLLLKKT